MQTASLRTHQCTNLAPFWPLTKSKITATSVNDDLRTFSAGDERIDDCLSTVEEVAELCFPDRQNAWILNTNAILKPKHRLLGQRTISNLQRHSHEWVTVNLCNTHVREQHQTLSYFLRATAYML